ncbi:MAG: PQQ-dependent sugar dehydrogenase, partial [Saprospiraceae bacterium]
YVHYTNLSGHSTISRFKSNPTNPNIADSVSEKIILVVNQPFNNHNAGTLKFGPDGYLFIGMGDGGSGGDPGNRSQNPKERLGKMLRIDVNTEDVPYLIPLDNPYRNNPDTLPEIWAIGLRNPWKFSFDVVNKEIWIADVGQDNWEEINLAPAAQSSVNYGWRCYEGKVRFNFVGCNDERKYLLPVHTYANVFNIGCSITGGYVYRGSQFSALFGKYIYTDFCTGKFWALYKDPMTNVWVNDELADLDNMEFATFGQDNKGELYVAGLANGVVYKITQNISSIVGNASEKLDITIRPNPAEHTIFVSLAGMKSKYVGYTIHNITGQIVKKNTQLVEDAVYFSIDINPLPPGLYFLKIENFANASKSFVKL